MTTLICPKCDKNYDSEKLRVYKCPECKKWLEWAPESLVKAYEPEVVVDELENLDPATQALVRAANRTTHAVRSLSVFLYITICTSLIGYGFIGGGASAAATCDAYNSDCGAGSLVIFGWIIILIGFIVGLISGMSELAKSRP